jgi:lipid-binding SYLF domain-containing protein
MSKLLTILISSLALGIAACATAPKTVEGRADLIASADDTLSRMIARDVELRPLLATSAGYAVFPDVGKGGLIVGGAHGRGVLYEGSQPVGYVQLSEASLGAQAGAEAFSELIVFENRGALNRVKRGSLDLGANVSAVALTAGAAKAASFTDGVVVFVEPRGGLMVDVSVSGQKISFDPGA